ncbi:cytochrome c biogenesis protein CcsA [Bacteroides helcogenes]|uniref:Cytochrome c assembly protein n=1 Tax=Bacteroides helcogenes (strain ATCC 35417 / DSM 20613 / JCM 6297 / CCUG 15421 / P 36-108) TaxID=693979 RepID=E6SUL3_BACT6|nr:cytochrome c biogenesis protein CcsA [Bacteroides helcogenes]ADV43377.1 cytochrome c assembly protein [Bacteroides helcogenes P 36-108]MDY5238145.1 cytochrome c biogenesis protein CcsA [Bacteroides helcogenes]
MKRFIIIIYVCLACLLAIATFMEQAHGTDFVEKHVYHTSWFCCLWGALAAMTVVALVRQRLWRRLPTLLLHGSFLVILAGAMTTFLCGSKGYVHLTVGSEVNKYVEQDGGRMCDLPFTLRLDSFRVEYYPGTDAPADYVSYIHDAVPVSMNHILYREGFRFYQSSFDEDMQGSWLTVNYDPWGTGITYTGYVLLGASMLWMLFSRRGEFRRLLRHPLLKKGGMFVLLLCLAATMQAQKRSLPALARGQADSLASRQVIYQDRVVPFNTLARDFVLKLTGASSYAGMTPEQVVGGWLLRPEVWQNEPMIYIKSAELRAKLHLPTPYARLADLFDGQKYRLQEFWKGTPDLHRKMTPLEKAVAEADEKVGLILMLQNGTLIRPLPQDGSVKPLSGFQVHAELLYNRIPFSRLLFMFNLVVGLLSFFYLLYCGLRRSAGGVGEASLSFFFPVNVSLSIALYGAFLFQLFGYSLRWYIGGRIPLSNGYETMHFLSLCTLFLACLLRRRFPFTLPFGFLLSGFALLVAYLGQMNPQITPLMPVLVSPWLSMHVSLIMMSYALFAFMLLNGILALCLRPSARMLMLLSRLLLYPAVFFLGAGIFMGAIWANISWGRYWAWDPKEVWALVTFMVYGMAFHVQSLRIFRKPLFFHVFMIAAFLTVLMTYFGVNYVLGGMHSYANS